MGSYDWFRNARFGLFVHWGLYAIPGGLWNGKEMDYIGEWLQAKFRIPNSEYEKLADEFNPSGFDAEQWVVMARNAGMKYIVLTAKHHEGFAMYHSKCSCFNIVDATPFKRDILAELAEACKKHDMKLGIYYSQDLDWHEFDGGDPGPGFGKNFGMSWGNDWDFPEYSSKNFQKYFDDKVIPQLAELLSHYGPISVIWFDCPLTISRENSERIVRLVKKLQPQCLINSRIGNNLGDYGSLGDNQLPAARKNGLWETPGTLNDTWGFKYNDHNWKKPEDIIFTVASLAAKDTNYLLNIGPQPDGRFPGESLEILKKIGAWFDLYGSAIYGTSGNPFPYDFIWGWMTVGKSCAGKNTCLNLILKKALPQLKLAGLYDTVLRIYDMVEPEKDFTFEHTASGLVVDLTGIHIDNSASVIVVELDTVGEPNVDSRLMPQDGYMVLTAAHGILKHGRKDGDIAESRAVGAAGEIHFATGHSFLDRTGCLVEWHNTDDSIEWEMFWPDAGKYQLDILLQARYHSFPCKCGQTLQVEYSQGDGKCCWEVVLDGRDVETQNGQCYAESIADLGTLNINRPGCGRMRISLLDSGGVDMSSIGLREIRVMKI